MESNDFKLSANKLQRNLVRAIDESGQCLYKCRLQRRPRKVKVTWLDTAFGQCTRRASTPQGECELYIYVRYRNETNEPANKVEFLVDTQTLHCSFQRISQIYR